MRVRPVRLALILTLSQASLFGVAQPADQRTASPPSISTIDGYLQAFAASYRAEYYQQESMLAAEANLVAAERALQPRATFEERLSWDDYAALKLQLGLGLALPLLSSTSTQQLELSTLAVESQRLQLRLARTEAKAALLLDLANLAAIDWAGELVANALSAVASQAAAWREEPTGGVDYVPPEQRAAFDGIHKLVAARSYFAEQQLAITRRLARATSSSPGEVQAPSLNDLAGFLDASAPSTPSLASCLENSHGAGLARLRWRSGSAHDELLVQPDYTLSLNADVDYESPAWRTSSAATTGSLHGAAGPLVAGENLAAPGSHGALSAGVSLELVFHVPEGWPLAGNAKLSVTPQHSEQSLSLAWPPLPAPKPATSDRESDLREELEDLDAELRALRGLLEQTHNDRILLERRLSWALLDLAPELSAETVTRVVAEALTQTALDILGPASDVLLNDPLIALELADLRVQHVFARVAEVSARVQYLSLCGLL